MTQVTNTDAAIEMPPEAACRRARPRAGVARPSTIRTDDAAPLDVTVEDLSIAGFRFSSATPIAVGTPITVGLAGAGRADAEVAWRKGPRHGCLFTPFLTAEAIEAAFTNVGATATIAPRAATIPARRTEMTWRVAGSTRFVLAGMAGASIWALIAIGLRFS